jgi:hypothetical protein
MVGVVFFGYALYTLTFGPGPPGSFGYKMWRHLLDLGYSFTPGSPRPRTLPFSLANLRANPLPEVLSAVPTTPTIPAIQQFVVGSLPYLHRLSDAQLAEFRTVEELSKFLTNMYTLISHVPPTALLPVSLLTVAASCTISAGTLPMSTFLAVELVREVAENTLYAGSIAQAAHLAVEQIQILQLAGTDVSTVLRQLEKVTHYYQVMSDNLSQFDRHSNRVTYVDELRVTKWDLQAAIGEAKAGHFSRAAAKAAEVNAMLDHTNRYLLPNALYYLAATIPHPPEIEG